MQHDKLVEKHLAKAGTAGHQRSPGPGSAPARPPTTPCSRAACTSPRAAPAPPSSCGTARAPTSACTAWRRCRRCRTCSISRNPKIKTLKDFTESDRIAMAGAGSSVQTTYLQMAAAKEFGIDNYKKLNPLMVNLPHPEGLRALLSGSKEITSQFTSPPFQNTALENPEIHTRPQLLRHHGRAQHVPHGLGDEEVPRREPEVLQGRRRRAEGGHRRHQRGQEARRRDLREGRRRQGVGRQAPEDHERPARSATSSRRRRILPFAHFMHQVGTIKNQPESWKDLFFPDIHDLSGS